MPRCDSLPPIATFSHRDCYRGSQRPIRNSAGHANRGAQQKTLSSSICRANILYPNTQHDWPLNRNTRPDKCLFICPFPDCPRSSSAKAFKRRYCLTEHLRVHSKEKPFICQLCNARFTTKSSYFRHAVSHKGLKPFVCSYCKKAYFRHSCRARCVKRHQLTASCGAGSASLVAGCGLAQALTDLRPRPFVCAFCPGQRAYTDCGSLRKHLRMHHPDRATAPSSLAPSSEPLPRSVQLESSWCDNCAESTDPHPLPSQQAADFLLVPEAMLATDVSKQMTGFNSLDGRDVSGLPVDLCTSALCLTMDEHFQPHQMFEVAPDSEPHFVHSGGISVAENSVNELVPNDLLPLSGIGGPPDVALDLTDFQSSQMPSCGACLDFYSPHAIDLSCMPSRPIDLSSQPQLAADSPDAALDFSTCWELEPGFSFTDLLSSSEDDTRPANCQEGGALHHQTMTFHYSDATTWSCFINGLGLRL